MSSRHRLRNILPLLYAAAVVIGAALGAAGPVAAAGAILFAAAWMYLSGPEPGDTRTRSERRAARTAARS